MIKIVGLKKEFEHHVVLDGLQMEVGDGELFGFIGPNGAGKTTTMKILAGLLKPDAGEVIINGIQLCEQFSVKRQLKRQIGYMPDFFGVYDNLTVKEYMEFFADIYHVPSKEQKKRIAELLEFVGLEHRSNDLVDTLSRGMKQKLCLARILVHDPSILLLDEPSSGMEPRARIEMKQILRGLAENGKTILISSHILSELSELCTSIGIIEQGRMLLSGSKEEVMRQAAKNRPIMLQVVDGCEKAVELLKQHAAVRDISRDHDMISASIEGDKQTEAEVLSYLVKHGILISSYQKSEGSLESLFVRLMQGKVE